MNCPRCKVPMTEGTVLVPGIHKSSDDLGGSVVTVSEGPATEGPVPCLKCPECGHSVVGSPDLHLTRKKAKQILAAEPGSEITGVVICCPDGRRAIVEMSAVRWMEKDEAWEMMHPKPDIPTLNMNPVRCPVCSEIYVAGEDGCASCAGVTLEVPSNVIEQAREDRLREGLANIAAWANARAHGIHNVETTLTMLERKAADLRVAVTKAGHRAAAGSVTPAPLPIPRP